MCETHAWECQELGWQCTKCLYFFFTFIYKTTFVYSTFLRNMLDMTDKLLLQIYIANSVIHHFEHISNITWNYGHLKSTIPVAGKSKVVEAGSRHGICADVSKWMWPKVSVVNMHTCVFFIFSLEIVILTNKFTDLTFWKLWRYVLCKHGIQTEKPKC